MSCPTIGGLPCCNTGAARTFGSFSRLYLYPMQYPASQIMHRRTGEGSPALMIHGNPATHTLWRPIAERVALERTVYTIDLPGFGASPPPPDHRGYSIPQMARTILDFADLHGIARFDLVGHSFGGAICIMLASEAPERIRSLAVLTPLTDHRPPIASLLSLPQMERIAGMVWRQAPSPMRRWFARQWTHISYGAGYSRVRSEEVAHEVDRADIIPSICGLMTQADYDGYRRCIRRVADLGSLPLLLVGAGADRIIPYAQFQGLRAQLGRASCHIFPHGGHVPMWQYPDEVAAIISRFWNEAGASNPSQGN